MRKQWAHILDYDDPILFQRAFSLFAYCQGLVLGKEAVWGSGEKAQGLPQKQGQRENSCAYSGVLSRLECLQPGAPAPFSLM